MEPARRRAIAEEGEIFYPLSMWPPWAQNVYMKPHKNRVERFTLWVFLVGNGLEPELARGWVLLGGGYDSEALRQMHELVTTGPTTPVVTYWDMANARNMVLQWNR